MARTREDRTKGELQFQELLNANLMHDLAQFLRKYGRGDAWPAALDAYVGLQARMHLDAFTHAFGIVYRAARVFEEKVQAKVRGDFARWDPRKGRLSTWIRKTALVLYRKLHNEERTDRRDDRIREREGIGKPLLKRELYRIFTALRQGEDVKLNLRVLAATLHILGYEVSGPGVPALLRHLAAANDDWVRRASKWLVVKGRRPSVTRAARALGYSKSRRGRPVKKCPLPLSIPAYNDYGTRIAETDPHKRWSWNTFHPAPTAKCQLAAGPYRLSPPRGTCDLARGGTWHHCRLCTVPPCPMCRPTRTAPGNR